MSKISLVDQFYISNSSTILSNIQNPGTNLCIWKRRVNQNVLDYAKQLILILFRPLVPFSCRAKVLACNLS
jgi:hypothetical protein